MSFFDDPGRVEDLSPSGDALFRVLAEGAHAEGRYLLPAGGDAAQIARDHGEGLFIDGVPHLALRNTLFRVE